MTNFDLEKRSELPAVACINCDQKYEGFFCPKCGQRELKGRFTIKESSGWILDKIFNLERGLFYTIKELFLRPHEMISNYLKRATVRYMHPLRFVFLLATISALVSIFSGVFESKEVIEGLEGYVEGWNMGRTEETISVNDLMGVVETIKKYFSFILILNIPVISIASFIIYFKRKYNFTEHLIIHCYAYGFSLAIGLPLYLLFFLDNGFIIHTLINTISYSLAYIYIFIKVFGDNLFTGLFKTLMIFLISVILSSIIILVISAVVSISLSN